MALAIGAVAGAALLLPGRLPAAVWPALIAVAVACLAARRSGAPHAGSAGVALPGVIGVLVVAIRVALGPAPVAPAALPEGAGPWSAIVESISAPRDGQQS
ncbi:MAG: hypothetical protein ACJ77B_10695, partial [Chloroflexota bacterium]